MKFPVQSPEHSRQFYLILSIYLEWWGQDAPKRSLGVCALRAWSQVIVSEVKNVLYVVLSTAGAKYTCSKHLAIRKQILRL